MKDKQITVVVEFDKNIDQEKLEQIELVEKVARIDDKNWLIQSTSDEVRQHIFNFAVHSGLSVLSMQKKEKTLEEVFQELTTNKS